ncbi:MAG: hypothetical protein J6X12_09165 [Paludibacteraceae bacterium]|nr:hypothetical protein [Paludibacteraceae bacterium]
MEQVEEKQHGRLPIGTYVILGVLFAYALWESLSAGGLSQLVLLSIALSHILTALKQKAGLLLFAVAVGILTIVLTVSIDRHTVVLHESTLLIWNLLDLVIQGVVLSIAMVLRKNGVTAFRMIWGKKSDHLVQE